MKAIILAASRGSSLLPFTATRPKPMIPVSGRYLIENSIELLKAAGVNDFVVIIGHERHKITSFFQHGDDHGVNLSYITQEDPHSIGAAVAEARNKVLPGEYFLLLYGDILTRGNIFLQTLQSFNSFRGPVAAICLTPSSKPYGNVYLDNQMRITRIIEKPAESDLGNYVLAGVFVLPSQFFELLDRTASDMEQALALLLGEPGLWASIWEDEWIDMVHPWDVLRGNRIMMEPWSNAFIAADAQLRGDVKIEGPVYIASGVVIESGSVLRGPCYVGPNTYVGNNVLIRNYTSIGSGCTIGYGVEMKNCVMFGHSRVGRLSFIGDSVIGENVNIGSGTMTVNATLEGKTVSVLVDGVLQDSGFNKLGAFIGDNVEIGASNTMPAGIMIEAGAHIPHHTSLPLAGGH